MTITQTTRAYETLIRHNPDGSTAAQHSQITEIIADGVVISANISLPVTLTEAAREGLELTTVLGDVATAALLSNDLLAVQVRSLESELKAQRRLVQQLQAELEKGTDQ